MCGREKISFWRWRNFSVSLQSLDLECKTCEIPEMTKYWLKHHRSQLSLSPGWAGWHWADTGADKLPDIPALELLCSQTDLPQPRPGGEERRGGQRRGGQYKDLRREIPLIPACCSSPHWDWPDLLCPHQVDAPLLHLNMALRVLAGEYWRPGVARAHSIHIYLRVFLSGAVWGVRSCTALQQVQLCWDHITLCTGSRDQGPGQAGHHTVSLPES